MRVFVTGATGFLGRALIRSLLDDDHAVVALSRRAADAHSKLGPKVDVVEGDPARPGTWQGAVAGCEAVINLAGEPVMARRWSPAHKERLRESRIEGTRRVVEAIEAAGRAGRPVATLIQGSAVGYYGFRDDERLGEQARPGEDFLARLCVEWEQLARTVEKQTRVVLVRTGIVVGPGGGALVEMARPFRFHAGGWVGSGRQWVSWIHLDDWVGLVRFALARPSLSGPINATAPEPVSMRRFAGAIGKALGRRVWAPAPAFALKLALGEGADVLLNGQRAVPEVALREGYAYEQPELDEAVRRALTS